MPVYAAYAEQVLSYDKSTFTASAFQKSICKTQKISCRIPCTTSRRHQNRIESSRASNNTNTTTLTLQAIVMNVDFLREASLHEDSMYKRSKADLNSYKPLSIDFSDYYQTLLADSEKFDKELRSRNEMYIVNGTINNKDLDIERVLNGSSQKNNAKTSITHPIKSV